MSRSVPLTDWKSSMAWPRSKMARTSGTVEPAVALPAALVIAWYSISVGITCATTTPTHASTIATKSNPMNEMPRCFCPVCLALMPSTPPSGSGCLLECADALEIAEVHPHQEALAHDVLVRNEPPVARIERVVAVVAHHEIVTRRHFAHHALDTVTTIFLVRERHDLGLGQPRAA